MIFVQAIFLNFRGLSNVVGFNLFTIYLTV
jgi:hypothetical protein